MGWIEALWDGAREAADHYGRVQRCESRVFEGAGVEI